jgi:hypothetical protein
MDESGDAAGTESLGSGVCCAPSGRAVKRARRRTERIFMRGFKS